MKLDGYFEIEKKGHNFLLIERYLGKDKWQSRTSYHGTVYQALQKYVIDTAGSAATLEGVRNSVAYTLEILDKVKEQIKDEFCIKVRVR